MSDHDERSLLRAEDGRLRVGWRIAIVVVAMTVATSAATMIALPFEGAARMFAAGVGMGIAGVGVFVVFVRRMDRRSVASYGLGRDRGWLADLIAGSVIGVVFAAATFGVFVSGGWAELIEVLSAGEEEGLWTGLAAALAYYAAVSLWEELTFRGYVISNAAESLARGRPGRRAVLLAVLASIPIFAAGHFNQFLTGDAPVLLAAGWWVAAGGLLGLAYAYTGHLALPLGIHLTLNLAGNRVFDLPGAETTGPMSTVLRVSIDGPGWITGAGGLAWFIGLAASALALWAWLRLTRDRTDVAADITGFEDHAEHDPGAAGGGAVRDSPVTELRLRKNLWSAAGAPPHALRGRSCRAAG
jgi:uncharacterized protein